MGSGSIWILLSTLCTEVQFNGEQKLHYPTVCTPLPTFNHTTDHQVSIIVRVRLLPSLFGTGWR